MTLLAQPNEIKKTSLDIVILAKTGGLEVVSKWAKEISVCLETFFLQKTYA